MARIHRKRYKATEIYAIESNGDGSGAGLMAVRVRSLREALGDSDALKAGVVALREHCYMVPMLDDTEVMMMMREGVVLLLEGLASAEASAFHAWLDAELPAPAVEESEARPDNAQRFFQAFDALQFFQAWGTHGADPEALRRALGWSTDKLAGFIVWLEQQPELRTARRTLH